MNDDRPGITPPPAAKPGADPAKARFYFVAGHRVLGAVLVVLGLMAMEGVLDWGEGLGKVLAIVGLIDFFLIPLVLSRMWRSLPK
jgi:hypothetical protein